MDNVELSRRLANLLRIGTIHEVNHTECRCRVATGAIVTDWLPWLAQRAGDTRTWTPPTVGEQVIIFSPSGELEGGLVLTGLYSLARPAPSSSADEHVTDYPDGARISYNHASGALVATGIQTARLAAAVSVTLDTPDILLTGRLTVDGHVTYRDGITGAGTHTLRGDVIHSDGDLRSHDVVLHTHHHDQAGDPV